MTTKHQPATPRVEVYEIPNTFTRDYTLDKQIELGINDWRAECGQHIVFGHTEREARATLLRELGEE